MIMCGKLIDRYPPPPCPADDFYATANSCAQPAYWTVTASLADWMLWVCDTHVQPYQKYTGYYVYPLREGDFLIDEERKGAILP